MTGTQTRFLLYPREYGPAKHESSGSRAQRLRQAPGMDLEEGLLRQNIRDEGCTSWSHGIDVRLPEGTGGCGCGLEI